MAVAFGLARRYETAVKPDRQGLQSWYREAMLKRIDSLVELREPVAAGSSSACDQLRGIGQALRGSGGTFGFPELSVAAGRVETTSDEHASRRLEGLLVELRTLSGEKRDEGRRVHEWMAVSAGLEEAEWSTEATTVDETWSRVRDQAGLSDAGLAEAIARRFNLEPAALSQANRGARRLVPEAFMAGQRVVPLAEDSTTITVATVDPVSLPTELELERLTGRKPVFVVAAPSALDAVLDGVGVDEAVRPSVAHEEPPTVGDGAVESDDGAPDRPAALPGVRVVEAASGAAPASVHGAVGGTSTSDADHPLGVLVVDDEPSARLLVRTLLEKRGFDTLEASDGLEALEVMRQHDHIGLAVVDLNMPRMDGLELIWELRDAGAWANLPVIVVTGEKDEILETQIMEEGADDYIRKPVDPRLFLARVEATLRRAGHAFPA